MQKIDYKAEVCPGCGQSTTYLLGIDRGTVDILKAIATAIRKKEINCVHPRKEMEIGHDQLDYFTMVREGKLTSNHVGNLSRPRFHGLIAKIKGKDMAGNYCLTSKGARFLKGEQIPKYAIISKEAKHQIGYYDDDVHFCTIKDFLPDVEYWEGIDFQIKSGEIIKDINAYNKAQDRLI